MKKLLQTPLNSVKSFLCLTIMLFCTVSLSAQKISGKVTDASGEPLIGSSVLVKGTSNGTLVGNDGSFSLDNVPKGSTLVVSFVGHQSKEVAADGNLSISLETSDALDVSQLRLIRKALQKRR